MERKKCGLKTEVYSRVVGYHRPTTTWNKGKLEEFKERKEYVAPTAQASNARQKAI